MCVLQGRGEAIEKYFETITNLRERGFAVATFDWRGQGGSERRLRDPTKCHVDSFAEYDRDLEAFVQQVVLPDCLSPYYALAHSSGALIALRAARRRQLAFRPHGPFGAARSTSGPTRPSWPIASRLAAAMTALGLGELSAAGQAAETMVNIPFEGNRLTGDPARFALNKRLAAELPQLFVRGPTYGWLYAASRAMHEAREPSFAAAIRVPTLFVIGALDRVVSVTTVERLASEMRSGGQVVIAGGEHELLMERDRIREQILAAFDAFVPGS